MLLVKGQNSAKPLFLVFLLGM